MLGPIFRAIAIRKLKITDPTWEIVQSTRLGEDFIVGGSPMAPYKSGPRKGLLHAVGLREKCVITQQDIVLQEQTYEHETGKCSRCLGEGKKPVSWSKEKGTGYRVCAVCKGSGLSLVFVTKLAD